MVGKRKSDNREQARKKRKDDNNEEQPQSWKNIFLSGTEWGAFEMIKTHQFTFETFEDSLRNGILAQQTRPVYLFGATEANDSFFLVPVIMAVTSIPTEPDTVGIASVQRTELLCTMNELKMSWTPLFLDRAQENDLERNITQFYALHCDQRDAVTRYLSEEQSGNLSKFTYCIPYIWTPRIAENCKTLLLFHLKFKSLQKSATSQSTSISIGLLMN